MDNTQKKRILIIIAYVLGFISIVSLIVYLIRRNKDKNKDENKDENKDILKKYLEKNYSNREFFSVEQKEKINKVYDLYLQHKETINYIYGIKICNLTYSSSMTNQEIFNFIMLIGDIIPCIYIQNKNEIDSNPEKYKDLIPYLGMMFFESITILLPIMQHYHINNIINNIINIFRLKYNSNNETVEILNTLYESIQTINCNNSLN